MTEYDQLAEHYDETRGGEGRGDEYAADVDAHLPAGDGPILEIGVGTGVVALGLRRRGRLVIGLDLSAPMLSRARTRLGPVVVLSDAMSMALATGSVARRVGVGGPLGGGADGALPGGGQGDPPRGQLRRVCDPVSVG
jgi:hypothetical protein